MSIEALSIVLNHSQAKGAAKLVLLGIANHVNPDNDGAWPSQAKLARYANVSDRAVRDAIETLVGLGELRYEVAGGLSANQYKPNRYWLTLRCPADCDGTANHKVRVEVSDSQGGSFQQSGWKQASDKPVIEPLREPNSGLKDKFNEFWTAYPRKDKKSYAAVAFYKVAKHTDPDVLIRGAEAYANDPNRQARYTRLAETWLNQEGWLDGPLPERELTAEEKEEQAKVAIALRRAREKQASDALKAEMLEARARAEANPPERCEHDRIKVVCPICRTTALG